MASPLACPVNPLVNHYFRHSDVRGLVWLDLETMGRAVHLLVVDHQGRAAAPEPPARRRAGSTQPAQRQTVSKSPLECDRRLGGCGTPWGYDPPRMTPLRSAAITLIDG